MCAHYKLDAETGKKTGDFLAKISALPKKSDI